MRMYRPFFVFLLVGGMLLWGAALSLAGMALLCCLVLLYGEEPTWFWNTSWRLEILVNTPRGIGEGTPTFLQMYLRRCTPGQFGSLRLVVAGAEKLNPSLAEAFEDHFGIRPLEGYGTTECSPVVAVSVPDFRSPGFFQPGARRGFVGQPLPAEPPTP